MSKIEFFHHEEDERDIKYFYADYTHIAAPIYSKHLYFNTNNCTIRSYDKAIGPNHGVELRKWVEDNCKSRILILGDNVYFEDEDEAILFKIRWI